ncbi:hypothetical protein [Kosakonia sacchari]|uniref:Uncharacterized protein n=1 Tax=Kosakonia sacchari TaxID=1158459 RepID=A0ABZ0MUA4_9ENTR|nr:hypothetical protein [Kosakonia sacchari]WOZ79084.1 hypothetical protein Q8Y70_08570 [Kosakonia sacchari]
MTNSNNHSFMNKKKKEISKYTVAQRLKEQAINSYTDYQKSREHLTGKEVSNFLRSGSTGELPECHR